MKRLFVFLLFIFTVSISFAGKGDTDTFYSFDLQNKYFEIKQILNYEYKPNYIYYEDIVSIAKKEIVDYYNKNTFEEPEWIRVKDFLTWMNNNEDSLNTQFSVYLFNHQYFDFFYELSSDNKKVFIGSFLGANYITKNITGKNFELQIIFGNYRTTVYEEKCGIRIKANNMIPAINRAIHETTHVLPLNDKSFIGKQIGKDDILSEEASILSQLKYNLPLKIKDENILSGARAGFMLVDREFAARYLDILSSDYAESVLSITKYSYYWGYPYWQSPFRLLELEYTNDNTIGLILSKLLYYRALSSCGKKFDLTDINTEIVSSPVYQETINEVYENIFADKIQKLNNKSLKSLERHSYELFEDNKLSIMMIFFKNLTKYADKNIPPVPKGYI